MSASGPPSESTPTESGSGERPLACGKSLNHSAGIVGVDDELDRVRRLLDAARDGSTQSLLVEGEPGIGKTTLLEAAQRMATGFRCLWVRGIESEAVLGHAGLLQLLAPIRDRLDEIPGAQADALSSALGWGAAPAPADRFLVGAATLSMLAVQFEHEPVLVLVDDLQWVDRESAAALGFAARRLSEDPVGFVWAARTGSVASDIAQGMPSLTLHGLSGTAARALVGDGLTAGVVGQLVDATSGNPLGMLEVIRRLSDAQRVGAASLPDPLPVGDRLGLVYEQLLLGLSEPARMATLLYALNRSGSAATVAAALAEQRADPAVALDEALDRDVLTRDGSAIGFRHPLLRAAALSLATPTQQRAAHRALAEALAGDPDSPARVWHRAEAVTPPDDELAADLVRVADRSRTRQGHAAASAALERAALLTGDASVRADRLAAAAVDAFLAGDVQRTRTLSGQVLDGSSVGPAHGQALFTLGTLEQYAGSVPRAADLLGEAVELLAGEDLVRALTELAQVRFRLNDVAGIVECATRIGPVASPDDPKQRMLSSFTRGLAATLIGDHETGRELLTEVIDLIGSPELDDPRSLIFLTLSAAFIGDPWAVMTVGERRLAEVRERGAVGVLAPALALTAAGRAWVGDHVGAYADAGEAAELGEQLGYAADTAVAVEMLAQQSASRGLHDDARAALDRAKVLTDRAGTTQFAAHQ
ncbi:MAG TPA: ATP-binding protein, partial [Nocardioidaceae bacterium]|nr:ATP-binding protein [Nocardioidaceae bacterium]